MLPSPAITRWSESIAFSGAARPAKRGASASADSSLPVGSRPRPFRSGCVLKLARRDEQHEAEAARVVVDDARARPSGGTRRGRAPRPCRAGSRRGSSDRPARFVASALDAERAGHAEMHEKHVAVVELGQQIFGAAAKRGDPAALQPRGEALRKGKAQIAAAAARRARSSRPPARAPGRAGPSRLPEARAFSGVFLEVPALMARQGAFLYGRAGFIQQIAAGP